MSTPRWPVPESCTARFMFFEVMGLEQVSESLDNTTSQRTGEQR